MIFLSRVNVLNPVLVVRKHWQRADCVHTVAENKKHWATIITNQALAHLIPSGNPTIVCPAKADAHLGQPLTNRRPAVKLPNAWITNAKINALTSLTAADASPDFLSSHPQTAIRPSSAIPLPIAYQRPIREILMVISYRPPANTERRGRTPVKAAELSPVIRYLKRPDNMKITLPDVAKERTNNQIPVAFTQRPGQLIRQCREARGI